MKRMASKTSSNKLRKLKPFREVVHWNPQFGSGITISFAFFFYRCTLSHKHILITTLSRIERVEGFQGHKRADKCERDQKRIKSTVIKGEKNWISRQPSCNLIPFLILVWMRVYSKVLSVLFMPIDLFLFLTNTERELYDLVGGFKTCCF